MAPLGLGHAVWCARDIIGDEPFAVLLPDMIMDATPGATAQMLAAYEETRGSNIIVVEPCPPGMAHQYGIVALEGRRARLRKMTGMVEKPRQGDGALQPLHLRPLRAEPRDLRGAGREGARRGRRDPAHRRHGRG